MMTNKRAELVPILRSETQARLLAALLLSPEREASITELGDEVGASYGNLHGDVGRMVAAGILAERRVGRTRLIRDAGSPYSKPLAELLLLAYGPKSILEDVLRGVDGIELAYIFGSWAARYSGEAGPMPNDIDLLVIGSPDRDDVHEIVGTAAQALHREVQVVFRTGKAWKSAHDGFAKTVKSRPLVELDLSPSLSSAFI
jgi:hypothetical protein